VRCLFFFFFQAEDGIRDGTVTGVQTCALPIFHALDDWLGWTLMGFAVPGAQALLDAFVTATLSFVVFTFGSLLVAIQVASAQLRSEERRVGKECRSRWWTEHYKKDEVSGETRR